MINKQKLFNASCFALITTAMAFAIRAGIIPNLNKEFGLTDEQVGVINSMAFFGFPVATIVGGYLYNTLGPKVLVWVMFVSHLIGILLTIFAGGYGTLLISTFFIGFANGIVESAFNPLIATMYKDNQTVMMNKFHVWFPGGIVIGALIVFICNKLGLGWQIQMATMLIPTLLYAVMFFGEEFPSEKLANASSGDNLKAMLNPIYLLMFAAMFCTANAELSTQQWVEKLLGKAGANPMLVLALVTGLMAVGRYFGGGLIHKFKPVGVLLGSAVIATVAIVLMSMVSGGMSYLAAILFAMGVCFFWPTLIGAVAEYTPKTGAIGMSIIGGFGMFASGMMQSTIGKWLDTEKAVQIANGVTETEAELAAGQATLDNLAVFPAVAAVIFLILFFVMKKSTPETKS
jgi:MFS transporter, putative metabolite:H+ symporter